MMSASRGCAIPTFLLDYPIILQALVIAENVKKKIEKKLYSTPMDCAAHMSEQSNNIYSQIKLQSEEK